jgi:hypothetical protein
MLPAHTVRANGDMPVEAGDVPFSELGIGYDADVLARQSELEELAEAELEGLPGEGEAAPTVSVQPLLAVALMLIGALLGGALGVVVA